tara:strand:+ start:188 stop:1276 length:1089 start_codon:yes stop_codon:yes gene_type:complete
MTSLQVVLFREDHKSFRTVVKISWFQIVPHVANLPSMKSTDILPWPNPNTERISWSVAEQAGVDLWVRRLDQIPGPSPGNKAYKLHWHLEKAARTFSKSLLTFGGPWSNHLHAVAAAGHARGIRTIGVVRGERPQNEDQLTDTLRDCEAWGMTLLFVSRAEYNEKHTDFFKAWLRDEFNNPWIVPEGGADALGVMGSQKIIEPRDIESPWDAILVSAGTGATAAGLAIAMKGASPLVVCSALKGWRPLEAIETLIASTLNDEVWAHELMDNIHAWEDAHEGGFAKRTPELMACLTSWEDETGLQLDALYTGKLVLALSRILISNSPSRPRFLASGSRILLMHTGGLQGNRSWRTKYKRSGAP